MPDFQFYFELIGAVAFAVSGAALAVKKGMDLFGVAVMGMTTAVGGGILRDMLLGLTPPAALKDPLQALVAIATSLLLFIVWKKWHPSGNHRVWESVLLAADSLGLGIFSVHGAAVAIRAGYGANVFLVLLVGVLTGVGAASCGTCAAWSGRTSSPSMCTPVRRWQARRCAWRCGAWARASPC